MNEIVTIDENYQHPSLDWAYRLKVVKAKGGGWTSRSQHLYRLADLERLIELAEMEHADCNDDCEVQKVLAALRGDA